MNRKYSGFTLVEMLIVMGIIIILMAVGIAAGRFAINRANDVAHQSAADQIFIAAQSYLTDTREYPVITDFGVSMAEAAACDDTSTSPCIDEYLSWGEFQGGTDATYAYWVDSAHSSALICVSLGGPDDESDRGWYCQGNGFSSEEAGTPGAAILEKEMDGAFAFPTANWTNVEDWNNDTKTFDAHTGSLTEAV